MIVLFFFFIEKGNTTMFEYTYGEVPVSIIEPPLNIKADEDESNGRPSVDADVWIQSLRSIYNKRRDYITILNILNRPLILITWIWMEKLILAKKLVWTQEAILIGETKVQNNLLQRK